jgi:AcrR family transcriptional regulator
MGRPRSDIEPRIVHAARERFLLEGVDGASLRDIAKDAGTSVGMIHYYFKTKDDLFLAVVEEVYAKLLDELSVAFAPDAPVRTRLSRAFRRLGNVTDDEQKVLRVVIREALVSSTRLDRLLARFRTGHLPLLFRALADGVASGEVDAELPLPLVMSSIAGMAVVPHIMRRLAGEAPPFGGLPRGEELAAIALEVLFRGIGPKPVPTSKRSPPRVRPQRRARPRRS